MVSADAIPPYPVVEEPDGRGTVETYATEVATTTEFPGRFLTDWLWLQVHGHARGGEPCDDHCHWVYD